MSEPLRQGLGECRMESDRERYPAGLGGNKLRHSGAGPARGPRRPLGAHWRRGVEIGCWWCVCLCCLRSSPSPPLPRPVGICDAARRPTKTHHSPCRHGTPQFRSAPPGPRRACVMSWRGIGGRPVAEEKGTEMVSQRARNVSSERDEGEPRSEEPSNWSNRSPPKKSKKSPISPAKTLCGPTRHPLTPPRPHFIFQLQQRTPLSCD